MLTVPALYVKERGLRAALPGLFIFVFHFLIIFLGTTP